MIASVLGSGSAIQVSRQRHLVRSRAGQSTSNGWALSTRTVVVEQWASAGSVHAQLKCSGHELVRVVNGLLERAYLTRLLLTG